MFKYAEIYGGKIRDVRESTMPYIDFVSLFSPKSYWLDVTGVDCEVGYVQSFKEGQGIIFIAPPSITPTTMEDVVDEYTAKVQEYLDATARERGYDGILSLCSYVTSTDATFAKEGQAGVAWRDAVWRKCYEMLEEVQAGTRTAPTDIISELPSFTWGD